MDFSEEFKFTNYKQPVFNLIGQNNTPIKRSGNCPAVGYSIGLAIFILFLLGAFLWQVITEGSKPSELAELIENAEAKE